MTSTVKIGQHDYRIGKLSALQQLHVSRRLAPILASMGVSLSAISAGAKGSNDDFAAMLAPVTEIVARMPDDEVNYIIFTCLSCVSRVVDNRAAPVSVGNALMFDDLDMKAMLELTVAALKDNLGNFLQGLVAETQSTSS